MPERMDQRVLGAIRFVDRATGERITRALSVESDRACFFRKTNGLYVITRARGLEAYVTEFETAPPYPKNESIAVEIAVTDPAGRYLPRRVRILLPRDPSVENSALPGSLFQPIKISLYPSVTAPLANTWSTIRASVNETDTTSGIKKPVAGSLIRVVQMSNSEILSSGISDPDGEALVIVPGIPIINFSQAEDDNGDPESVKTEIRLELSHRQKRTWPTNPDDLERDHAGSIRFAEKYFLQTGTLIRETIELQPVS